jgi:hypothetical protein
MSARLMVTRKHPLMELRRGPFETELDGRNAGVIRKPDETMEMAVEPGHHVLRMWMP